MSNKTTLEQELESLREKAVARNARDKYSGAGSFRTPEDAMAYLAKQRKLQDQPIAPPTNITSSSELSDWYMVQRQREIDGRKKREEAEAYLRAYKPQPIYVSKSFSNEILSSASSHESETLIGSNDNIIILPISSHESETSIGKNDVNVISSVSQDSSKDSSNGSKYLIEASIAKAAIEEIDNDENVDPIFIFSDQAETLRQSQIHKESCSFENVEVALSGTTLLPEDVTHFSPRGDEDETRTHSYKSRPSTAQNYHTISPTLPFSLTDLSDWYMIQRQRELEERKKREEAEAYLRSYRPQWFQTGGKERKPNTTENIHPLSVTTDVENKESASMNNNDNGDGPRLSPVLRMVSQFLKDHFRDDEMNSIFFPSLNETDPLCHTNTSTEPHTEVLSDLHNRFELFLSQGCHISHQIAVALCLKGLTNLISLSYCSNFSSPTIENRRNEDEMIASSGEFLSSSVGSAVESLPLPSLWDKKEKSMVTSDPFIILQKINSEFNNFARFPFLDLYPLNHREKIDDITKSLIYKGLYEGAISCGVAKSQEEYDAALGKIYISLYRIHTNIDGCVTNVSCFTLKDMWTESFEQVHALLQIRRYIGDTENLTLADIALFTILVRVEAVFSTLFLVNNRSVLTHPVLLNYLREIFQMPNVDETVDLDATKSYYYRTYSHITM